MSQTPEMTQHTMQGSSGLHTPATNRRPRPTPALFQLRQPVFWLWALFAVPAVIFTIVESVMQASDLTSLIAAVVLVGVQAVLIWLILRAIARKQKRPVSLTLGALVWGGAVAIMIAGLLNSINMGLLNRYGLDSLAATISAPINEDILRFIGTLIILTLAARKPLTVMDGVWYGFLVGAGFELLENLSYALSGEDLSSTLSTGIMRLIVGFALHALWTATTGAVLAYCIMRVQQKRSSRWYLVVPALLIPMALHAAWDLPSLSVFEALQLLLLLVLYVLTLAAFFAAVIWGRRSSGLQAGQPTGQASSSQSGE